MEKKTYITFPLREKKLPYNKKKLVKNKHTFTKKNTKKIVTQITFSLIQTHQKKRYHNDDENTHNDLFLLQQKTKYLNTFTLHSNNTLHQQTEKYIKKNVTTKKKTINIPYTTKKIHNI